jgi:transposase
MRRDAVVLEARRLSASLRIQRGESLSLIARDLGITRQAVSLWARQYRRHGEAGLRRIPRLGRPAKLSRAQLAQLPRLLARGAQAYGFPTDVWTIRHVAELIRRRFRVRYCHDHLNRLLHRLGLNWRQLSGHTPIRAAVRPGNALGRGHPNLH